MPFVAIDDHARIAFTLIYPVERAGSAVAFLRAAAGAVVMGGAIVLVGRVVSSPLPFLLLGGGIGGLVYLAVTWLLGGRELQWLWRTARTRAA